VLAGDKLKVGGFGLAILWPQKGYIPEDGRGTLGLLIKNKSLSCLLPGNIGKYSQEEITRAFPNLQADLIKLPRKGKKAQTGEGFISWILARWAVIQQGKKYFGRYPANCGSELQEKGVDVYLTSRMGAIIFTAGGDGIKISTGLRSKEQ